MSRSTNKHRRFLERSNEVMEFSINIARSKGQNVKVNPVFPRNVSRHIDPVCNMGLCASIRLVSLTLVSHCFTFHRNVKCEFFFNVKLSTGKTQKKCIVTKLSG